MLNNCFLSNVGVYVRVLLFLVLVPGFEFYWVNLIVLMVFIASICIIMHWESGKYLRFFDVIGRLLFSLRHLVEQLVCGV